MRMTKPISHHLTTGTFNYVVKDPNCNPPERAALDQGLTQHSQICVLELDALDCRLVLTDAERPTLDYFLPPAAKLSIPLEFSFGFREPLSSE